MRLKNVPPLLTTVLLAGLLAACSNDPGSGGTNQGPSKLQSEKQRITNPQLAPGDLETLTAGERAFAFDLTAQLDTSNEGNLFHSPISIFEAMAMVYAGARGQTASEMADVLHFDLPQDRLHPAVNALDLALAQRGQGAHNKDGEPFQLHVVNALWAQQGYHFSQEYLDTISLNYGAGIFLLDFSADPDAAAHVINDWVEDQTEDRIKDLIPDGALSPLTRLVLTNAIYFNASWAEPFEEDLTTQEDFHLLDGSTAMVDMMHGTFDLRYARVGDFQAVEIPYEGDEVAMLVVLPDEGTFESVVSNMDGQTYETLLSSLEDTSVDLSLPKFTYETSYELNETFQDMGLVLAFTGQADLSGINDGVEHLSVSKVIHKAFVAVDEAGTEAAAATAVVVPGNAGPVQTVPFTVDRPFLFYIVDKPTGAILFAGTVENPTAN